MISEDAQKALDDLTNYSTLFGASNSEVEEGIAEEAKDWLITHIASLEAQLSEARARLAWIPVSERLPEDAGFVLVKIAYEGVTFGQYISECGMWLVYKPDSGRDYKLWLTSATKHNVTHWKPRPEAPKEDE